MTGAELAGLLLDLGAVRLSPRNPFTWASGLRSPIYCDNRQLLGHAEVRGRVVAALAERASSMNPTLVAGTATAGIPWAAMVAQVLGLPMAYVRPEAKRHGMGRHVEGPSPEGHNVVLLEDLVSTGGSSLRCVEALREAGGKVLEVLALFGYGLPQAEKAFADAEVPCFVLATFGDLQSSAAARGILDKTDELALSEWRLDVAAWSRAFEAEGTGSP